MRKKFCLPSRNSIRDLRKKLKKKKSLIQDYKYDYTYTYKYKYDYKSVFDPKYK